MRGTYAVYSWQSTFMSASFFTSCGSVVVSNKRSAALVEFALACARRCIEENEHALFVSKFESESSSFFPGHDFDLEELFSTSEERQFWSDVFATLASGLDAGTLGNQVDRTWAPSAASDARRISVLLAAAALRPSG